MSSAQKRTSYLGLDIFKLIVAIILVVILVLLLMRGCGAGSLLDAQTTEEPTAEETEQVAEPTHETAATDEPESPTPTAEPAASVIPVITAPDDGAEVPAGDLVVQGTAAPGADIELVENGEVIATTQADGTGQWQVTLTPDPGDHTYSAQPAGDASSVSGSVTVTVLPPVAVGGCPPGGTHGFQPDEFHYVVGSCDTLSGIASYLGVTIQALLDANPQITNPDRIYPGQVINVP